MGASPEKKPRAIEAREPAEAKIGNNVKIKMNFSRPSSASST